jgi:hypothetical protein
VDDALCLHCARFAPSLLAGNSTWILTANQIRREDSYPSLPWEAVTTSHHHAKKGEKNNNRTTADTTYAPTPAHRHRHTDRQTDRTHTHHIDSLTHTHTLARTLSHALTHTLSHTRRYANRQMEGYTTTNALSSASTKGAHHTQLHNIQKQQRSSCPLLLRSLPRKSFSLLFTLPLLWLVGQQQQQQHHTCSLLQSTPSLSTNTTP